ncbi:MAG: CotH kinase family protein, partial [Myxococcota bacterium]
MFSRKFPTPWMLLGSVLLLSGATSAPEEPEPPTFSVQRGFHDAPLAVTLTTNEPGALIRYTTDGSEPDENDGEVYSGPITISSTTALRAVTVTPDGESEVVTHTYIFVADVIRQPENPPDYPAQFAETDEDGPYPADYGMDPEVVASREYGDALPGALRSIPTISLVTDADNLFGEERGIYYNATEKGEEWERPVSMEWLDPNRNEFFGLNAGARVHGQGSRQPYRSPKKSIRLYFRGDYGPTKLEFPVFAASAPELANRGAARKFDILLLRNGGNRSWPYFSSGQRADADYVNDEFARAAFRRMGHLAPHGGVFVHLYLNGLYWGLYNLCERVDGEFLTNYLGGEEDDYDLILPDEDAEPSYAPTAALGSIDAWNELHALVEGPISDAVYDEVVERADLVNLADYIILTHHVGNSDWPNHNWYAYRSREGADTRFKFIPWDNDSGLRDSDRDITDWDEPGSPARLFLRLVTHPAFRELVNERVVLHTSGTGALTGGWCDQLYRALTDIVDQAVIAESARWGDYARDVYHLASRADQSLPAFLYTRDDFWVPVRDEKLTEYCPERTGEFLEQYSEHGWYTPGLLAPTFSHLGGAVPHDFSVELENPNNDGELVYTLDGADPRDPSGRVAPTALWADDHETLMVHQLTVLSARVRDGDDWSPLARATYFPPQDESQVVINELHYAPVAGPGVDPRALEFVELHNKGSRAFRLDAASFSRGISYVFPAGTSLPGGGYLVLAANADAFQQAYGFVPHGVFDGQLANDGEKVELLTAMGNVIDQVAYGTTSPWPLSAAGSGASLELVNPELDPALPGSWQSSFIAGGTPGAPNSTRDSPASSSSLASSSSSSSSASSLSTTASCACSSFSGTLSSTSTVSSSSAAASSTSSTSSSVATSASAGASSAAVASSAASTSSSAAVSSSSSSSSGAPTSAGPTSTSSCGSSTGSSGAANASSGSTPTSSSTGGGGGDDG